MSFARGSFSLECVWVFDGCGARFWVVVGAYVGWVLVFWVWFWGVEFGCVAVIVAGFWVS